MSRLRLSLLVLGCLLAVTFVFSPRLWLMAKPMPGTYQWDRANTFMLQAEAPLRRDIEPAMLWRLLPPAVCHAAGLRGTRTFLVPWLGLVASVAYVAVLLRRREPHWKFVFGGTLLFASTSAVLVPLHWFGVNDGWVWLALLAVAFGRLPAALPLACLLAPWVDERFIIGLPLALVVRAIDSSQPLRLRALLVAGLWLLPYAGTRVVFSFDPAASQATRGFLGAHLQQLFVVLPWAPLAWWMGLRVAWLPVAVALTRRAPFLWLVAAATAGISLWLAADMSRSIAILCPLLLLGCFDFLRSHPDQAPRTLLTVGLANLLVPAAHIVHTKFDLISPLPLELFRLLRGP